MIIYDEHPIKRRGGPIVKYENLNACKHWITHYSNYRYLKFLFDNTPDFREKRQANREMGIAMRKMAYWEKHPNYDVSTIREQRYAIDSQWDAKRS